MGQLDEVVVVHLPRMFIDPARRAARVSDECRFGGRARHGSPGHEAVYTNVQEPAKFVPPLLQVEPAVAVHCESGET